MENKDEGKSPKSDKSSSSMPTGESFKGNLIFYGDELLKLISKYRPIFVYSQDQHNFHAMQAYYGMPPYYNSAVASGHAPPPYMYILQFLRFRDEYRLCVFYDAAAPADTPTKSSGNTEHGLMKKLKGFDGLAISIGNGTAENAEGRAEPRPFRRLKVPLMVVMGIQPGQACLLLSLSLYTFCQTDQGRRKRSREGTPTTGGDGKIEAKSNPVAAREVIATVSPGMTTCTSLQNERELKRERRKQSNIESARRSRLRKQAETEELARKVESLTSENATLRSEINQLTEKSEKLRLENAILVGIAIQEGLKKDELGHARENILSKKEDKEGEMCEEKSDSSSKLHQLLDPSPRADAVAAS
ncbi:G-box binding factor 3, putative isoform 2 [Hibiscus syriacus]|uniref:G-box binding factor 3, putative isoform 2 n=1 Tax=Hibiscus syriacus TaxID=106335 RepID=A0A6A3BXY9_HIBSY|nr:G-box binding factor 3, putative isoform 2 [Hibiscus syriacus]